MDIATEEEPKEETVDEKPTEIETNIEPTIQPKDEEPVKAETPTNDDEKITEIINEEATKPKSDNREKVTCEKCGKTMLKKNYKYQHQAVCGKVKVKSVQEEPKPMPVEVEQVTPQPPPEKPKEIVHWTLRKEYSNQLHERKINLVKKLVSRAF